MSFGSYVMSLILPDFKFEFLAAAAAVMGIVGGASTLMNSGGGSAGSNAQNQANPLAPYQQGWAEQLNALMKDPSSITNTPGYKFGMEQGQQTLQRGMAATGQTQSGAEQIGLQRFGEQYAGQQYQQQISNLGNLATNNAIGGQQAGANQQQGSWNALGQGMMGLANIYGTPGGGYTNTNQSGMTEPNAGPQPYNTYGF